MLKLKLQYLGHLMQTADSLKKSLMLGKIEGRRRREHQRMRWLDGIPEAMEVNPGKLRGDGAGQGAWRAAVHEVTESDTTGQLNNDNHHNNTASRSTKQEWTGPEGLRDGPQSRLEMNSPLSATE